MKTTTVYWSPAAINEFKYRINLITYPPKPIWPTLPKKVESNSNWNLWGNYRQCQAAHHKFKNVFVMPAPMTTKVTLSGGPQTPQISSDSNLWIPRSSSFEDSYAVEVDMYWHFFTEEDGVIADQTPPYMHNPTTSKGGFVVPASFDISKWFRPMPLSYTLWKGNDTLEMTEGEPAFYVNFKAKHKVVLKQFELTQDISDFSNEMAYFKKVMPHLPLSEIYSRFARNNSNKIILKKIKKNLID